MKRAVYTPKSQLAKWKAKIAKAVPGGLPKSVAALYAKSDGLTVTIDGEDFTIVGLRDMFANVFEPPTTIKKAADAESALAEGAFVETLYAYEVELDGKAGLARANLLLRLKLLASFPGESAAFAIDFYSGAKEPVVYVVDQGDQALPLHLSFTDFVALFEKFGTRRWYYAFLDAKAAKALNVNLASELEASLSAFDDPEVAALRVQFKRGAKPDAWKAALKTASKAGKASKSSQASKVEKPAATKKDGAADLESWCVSPPAIDLGKGKASVWRDAAAYAIHATKLVGKSRAINDIAAGVRKAIRAKNDKLDWAVVAVAGKAFAETELFALIRLGMPAAAFAVLTKHRGWSTAQLGSLANRAQYVWKKDPTVPPRILEASTKLWADIQKKRVILP